MKVTSELTVPHAPEHAWHEAALAVLQDQEDAPTGDVVAALAGAVPSPAAVLRLLRAWQTEGPPEIAAWQRYGPYDAFIDRLLFGQTQRELDSRTSAEAWAALEASDPTVPVSSEVISNFWTPYSTMRALVRYLKLGKDDVFYDLGAGYSAVPLYAAAMSEATCKGVELIDSRVQITQEVIGALGLQNVSAVSGNVLDQDLQDGTVFYMYSPFDMATGWAVLKKLEAMARARPITIVLRYWSGEWLREGWLGASEQEKLGGALHYVTVVRAGPESFKALDAPAAS